MDDTLKSQLRLALNSDNRDDALQKIVCNNDIDADMILLVRSIVHYRIIRSPKDDSFGSYLIERYTAEQITTINLFLKEITTWSIPTYSKARIYDFIWVTSKEFFAGEQAERLYKEYCMLDLEIKFFYTAFNRGISLLSSLRGNKADYGDYSQIARKFIEGHSNEIKKELISLFQTCFDYRIIPNQELMDHIENALNCFEKDDLRFDLIEEYCKLYEKAAKKSDPGLVRIRRLKADNLIAVSKSFDECQAGTLHRRIVCLKNAIATLKQIPNSENERTELLKELEMTQKEFIPQMQSFNCSIDISDTVRFMIAPLELFTKEESLYYIAYALPFTPTKAIRERIINRAETDPLSQLFSPQLLDENGKVVACLPALNTASLDEASLQAHIIREIATETDLIGHHIAQIKRRIGELYEVTEADIERIVADSSFIPKERKNAYVKGLYAGFTNDYITSLSILVPQFENSIRTLAALCGEPTYKPNSDGTEELMSMNGVLNLPKVRECFDEDFLLSLLAIFCSKYGINIRNAIAHGMVDDDKFNTYHALYVWWFIFKMCYCYTRNEQHRYWDKVQEVIKKMNQQAMDKNDLE